VTPAALAALSSYAWPGNVRELRNAVERAAVLGGAGPLDPQSFALGNGNGRNGAEYAHAGGNGSNGHAAHGNGTNGNGVHQGNGSNGTLNGTLELKAQVEAVERRAIQRALEASGGNRRQAASLLGISLRTLFYKMRRLPVD
jgi:two-component system response regulator PilR (NtrC family)